MVVNKIYSGKFTTKEGESISITVITTISSELRLPFSIRCVN